jgi:hypothetical protein
MDNPISEFKGVKIDIDGDFKECKGVALGFHEPVYLWSGEPWPEGVKKYPCPYCNSITIIKLKRTGKMADVEKSKESIPIATMRDE